MRKLIVEFPINEFAKLEGEQNIDWSLFEKVKLLEILQTLRRDQDGVAVIGRIELENEAPAFEECIRRIFNKAKVHFLKEGEEGVCIFFVEQKWVSPPFTAGIMKGGGYAIVPREIDEGKVRLTLLGSTKQLNFALKNLGSTKMLFRVISLTDARFLSDSPLNMLTEKQREVLTSAYRLGYYNTPRKIDSDKLARKLHLKPSTLVVHRRKAEYRLLTSVVNETIERVD